MEEFDTTTPEKTESERQADAIAAIWEALDGLNERLEALNPRNGALAEILQRLANLEARRILQADPNDDEEWY